MGGTKGGKGSGRASRQDTGGRGIYVSGFDYDTDEAALQEHFGDVGTIEEVYFQSMGAAVVTFTEKAAAQRAVSELHESTIDGQSRYVSVKLDNVAHRKQKWG